jgi:hypothetical protein
MYNINPTLIHGLALQWASAKYPDDLDNPYKRQRLDVRVYESSGSGYYFIHGHGPGKWYYRDDATVEYFTKTTMSEVQSAIDANGRVQIVGDRGKSFGVWDNWEKFTEEVISWAH